MQFYWTPETEQPALDAPLKVKTRLARFLTLSTAAHIAGAGVATWLSLSLLPPRVDESQLVRTIDFVEPTPVRAAAPGPSRREPAGGSAGRVVGAPGATAPARPSPPVRAPAVAPQSVPAAPAPAPARTTASDTGDLPSPTPSPSPEEARLAAATPKAIGSAATRGPATVSTPSRDSSPSPSAAPAVLGRADGSDAPMATVALPPGLVRGSGAGGSGSGIGTGSGSSGGTGTAGGSATGAGGGGGGTGTDLGDPDFSDYFRLIEKRVRAAWKFPDSLGGTTQTVKIGFALAPEGSLRDARVVSSSTSTLNDSALAAMRRAAPFPPLPAKFRGLAGQPLVMNFTVTIR